MWECQNFAANFEEHFSETSPDVDMHEYLAEIVSTANSYGLELVSK